jgi:hypothetical protein
MAQRDWAAECSALVMRHICPIASWVAVVSIPVLGYLYQQELATDKEVAQALTGLQSDMKLVMFRLDNPQMRQNAGTIPAHAAPAHE